jgi:hypothetical protein
LQTLPKFAGIIVDLIVLPVLLIIDLQCWSGKLSFGFQFFRSKIEKHI